MIRRWVPFLAGWLVLSACERKSDRKSEGLSFGTVTDTTELSRGAPLLAAVEPYRMANGALRVRGRLDPPDGARLQISVIHRDDSLVVGRVHVIVQDRGFDDRLGQAAFYRVLETRL